MAISKSDAELLSKLNDDEKFTLLEKIMGDDANQLKQIVREQRGKTQPSPAEKIVFLQDVLGDKYETIRQAAKESIRIKSTRE